MDRRISTASSTDRRKNLFVLKATVNGRSRVRLWRETFDPPTTFSVSICMSYKYCKLPFPRWTLISNLRPL